MKTSLESFELHLLMYGNSVHSHRLSTTKDKDSQGKDKNFKKTQSELLHTV